MTRDRRIKSTTLDNKAPRKKPRTLVELLPDPTFGPYFNYDAQARRQTDMVAVFTQIGDFDPFTMTPRAIRLTHQLGYEDCLKFASRAGTNAHVYVLGLSSKCWRTVSPEHELGIINPPLHRGWSYELPKLDRAKYDFALVCARLETRPQQPAPLKIVPIDRELTGEVKKLLKGKSAWAPEKCLEVEVILANADWVELNLRDAPATLLITA